MYLPEDFINRMKNYLGDEYEAFIASYDNPEVKGLRLNTKALGNILGALCAEKIKSENMMNEGQSDDELAVIHDYFVKIPWTDNGYSYFSTEDDDIRPGKHPYHEAGAYYIQEPSAMAPAVYLNANPGDRVLDLCAAPGGKSTQIADMLSGEGILISNEIMPDRAKILSENIERMGVKNALVISEDPRNISGKLAGYFDKILVDAPCSGEGMFRRSETAVGEWSLENVSMCADRQAWILDEAALMLRPGGRLVYSTCTFSKEEDEETIKAFLARHEDFELETMPLYGQMRRGFEDIGVRLWPHLVNGEGHYVCSLKKKNPSEVNIDDISDNAVAKIMPPCGYEKGINKKDVADLKDMYSFIDKNIVDKDFLKDRVLVRFKEQIYMVPNECPNLMGLKVIRPGIHLGELKKNRFEPAHALAKVMNVDEVVRSCGLTKNNSETYKYINGETFYMPLPNGWYVNYIDGVPIGWGKITNEIMKNHYPKGLRKNLK